METDEEVRIKELKSQTRELEQEKKALLIQAAAAEKEEKLSAEIAALEEQLLLYGKWQQEAEVLLKLESRKEELLESAEKQITAQKEQAIAYETYREEFFRSQAGLLARDLEEGKPCPVCGSRVHPAKAACEKQELSEAALKEMEAQKEKTSAELQRTLTALAENEKEWQTRMEHLRREEVLAGKKAVLPCKKSLLTDKRDKRAPGEKEGEKPPGSSVPRGGQEKTGGECAAPGSRGKRDTDL
ncbi:hypothetical protein LC724_05085 [Blautia sp. RD014234]|nr:hypothetical protein [Blautia parvula]